MSKKEDIVPWRSKYLVRIKKFKEQNKSTVYT
jgi:hypothetical protein